MTRETRSRVVHLGAVAPRILFTSLLVVGPAHAAEGLRVGESPHCRVTLTQVSYDDPGADDAEFLELHVDAPPATPKTPSPSPPIPSCGPAPADAGSTAPADGGVGPLTLGACGLEAIELVNGGGGVCEVYRSLPLADVPVPADGYVVFCATDAALTACDVTTAGHSALRNGWLQNGPTDGLRFVGVGGEVTAELAYEGTPACFSTNAVALLPETGVLPGGAPDADDVNAVCDDRFTFFSPAQSPLRAPLPCPVVVGSDAGAGDAGAAPPGAGKGPAIPERAPQTSSYHANSAPDGGLALLPQKGASLPRPPSCAVSSNSAAVRARSLAGALSLALTALLVRSLRRRVGDRRVSGRLAARTRPTRH